MKTILNIIYILFKDINYLCCFENRYIYNFLNCINIIKFNKIFNIYYLLFYIKIIYNKI